jgi:hypothetical protein
MRLVMYGDAVHSLLLGVHDRARPPDAAITSKPRYNQVLHTLECHTAMLNTV